MLLIKLNLIQARVAALSRDEQQRRAAAKSGQLGTHFACFTGTKAQILTQKACFTGTKVQILTQKTVVATLDARLQKRVEEAEALSVCGLKLKYRRTNTCFTGTKVQILTQQLQQRSTRGCSSVSRRRRRASRRSLRIRY
jgi:hypothetical protein